jgi:ribose 5-phosphate isomerase A
MEIDLEREKKAAAEAAAPLVEDGMLVGLGTGSTVAYLLPALAARNLSIRCVSTSPRTEATARELGLPVEPFEGIGRLDIAIDGADQIAPDGWLVKGGGAAHTREKIVAAAAERFVVIADSSKVVDRLEPPVPLELLVFGLEGTLRAVQPAELRDVPLSPDGGVIADYRGPVGDPLELAARLAATPGVVEHGLFPPALVSRVLVATESNVRELTP